VVPTGRNSSSALSVVVLPTPGVGSVGPETISDWCRSTSTQSSAAVWASRLPAAINCATESGWSES
jgi:hypothetical protein